MHYRRMYDDSEMLYAFDLEAAGGQDVVLVIEKVSPGSLEGQKGRKSKKPFVKFAGREKKLALNKTNGKAIATLYGADTDAWVGKPIAIYATTTDFGGETVECIRVRPKAPEMPKVKNGKSKAGDNDLTQQIADEMKRNEGDTSSETGDDRG